MEFNDRGEVEQGLRRAMNIVEKAEAERRKMTPAEKREVE